MNGLIKDFIIDYPSNVAYSASGNANGTYSVCDEDQSTSVDEVRASLAEIMSVATDSDPNTFVLDVRSLAEYNGTRNRNDVTFEGTIKGAAWNEWKTETTTGTAGAPGTKIKSKGQLKVLYAAIGLTKHDTAYIF